jgi:hypothetical protein
MIGQYLLNNNEKHYSTILSNFSDVNRPLLYVHTRNARDKVPVGPHSSLANLEQYRSRRTVPTFGFIW